MIKFTRYFTEYYEKSFYRPLTSIHFFFSLLLLSLSLSHSLSSATGMLDKGWFSLFREDSKVVIKQGSLLSKNEKGRQISV